MGRKFATSKIANSCRYLDETELECLETSQLEEMLRRIISGQDGSSDEVFETFNDMLAEQSETGESKKYQALIGGEFFTLTYKFTKRRGVTFESFDISDIVHDSIQRSAVTRRVLHEIEAFEAKRGV